MMTVEEFGAELLRTGDLDPIYVMLNRADLDESTKARWCLAYWCFYHAGFASYAADNADRFWRVMAAAANNTTPSPLEGRWPRGAERRHFRAANSINSVAFLDANYPSALDAVQFLLRGGTTFRAVKERVLSWPSFGPWIAFKIADMLDAVMGVEIDFSDTVHEFFDDPKEGARIVAEGWGWVPGDRDHLSLVVGSLLDHFGNHPVPHAPQRGVRHQEVETILCKYKSHTKGRYEPGKDTKEIIHGLQDWKAVSPLAGRLQAALQQGAG
jgi:hypothetical protein